jgi:hypothetical protein
MVILLRNQSLLFCATTSNFFFFCDISQMWMGLRRNLPAHKMEAFVNRDPPRRQKSTKVRPRTNGQESMWMTIY